MSDLTLAALASGAKSNVVLTPELEKMGSSLPKVHDCSDEPLAAPGALDAKATQFRGLK
jgi:hypothetical protein